MTVHATSHPSVRLPRLVPLALALGVLAAAAGPAAPARAATCPGLAAQPEVCPGATHTGPDYSGRDLRNENFANQDLAGADFTGAQLEGTTFDGADLTGADFRGASLGYSATFNRSTSFVSADLTEACFANLALPTVRFDFADLDCSDFFGADVRDSHFGPRITAAPPGGSCRTSFAAAILGCEFIPQWKQLDLRAANVQECYDRLAGADFSGGWMSGIIFSGLDLTGSRWVGTCAQRTFFVAATLDDAVLSGIDLRGSQLSTASARRSRIDQQARLSGANLTGVNLEGANLEGAVFEAADGWPTANLSLAFLANARLTDAALDNVNLSHASFYGNEASADNASMTHVDFANANLSGADLTDGELLGVRLDSANLVNTRLRGANLRPVNGTIGSSLVQASLQGADLTEAQLQGANLANAAVALDQGVPLFQAAPELAADLDRRWLSAEVVDEFTQHGLALVPCAMPSVGVEAVGSSWRIVTFYPVGPSGATFRAFALARTGTGVSVSGATLQAGATPLFQVSDPDGAIRDGLDDGLLASRLLAAFSDEGYPLPPCSNPEIEVVAAGGSWTLTEQALSANTASLGYTGFRLILEGGPIEVYGAVMTVVRPDAEGQLSLQTVSVQPTLIDPSSFDDLTVCPNQSSYGANLGSGLTWKQMMTAVAPPAPPACIPSLFTFCPSPRSVRSALSVRPGNDSSHEER